MSWLLGTMLSVDPGISQPSPFRIGMTGLISVFPHRLHDELSALTWIQLCTQIPSRRPGMFDTGRSRRGRVDGLFVGQSRCSRDRVRA